MICMSPPSVDFIYNHTSCSISMLSDASLVQTTLDPVLFPGVGNDVWVHCGFAEEQAK